MNALETQAQERAMELHAGGLHCAESVLLAVLEARGACPDGLVPRVATCFGAGVGRTKEELCGALSGGLMAIGCAIGRERMGQGWDLAAEAGAEMRERFKGFHGTTRCAEILEALGPQEDSHLCRRLTGQTAGLTLRVLDELS